MKFAKPDIVVDMPDIVVGMHFVEATVTVTLSQERVAIAEACAEAAGKNLDRFLLSLFADAIDRLKKPKVARQIVVPAWVPEALREDYLEVARLDGEEAAASWARREKRRGAS